MFLKGECADFPDSWSDRMWGPDDLPNQRTQYELRRAAVRICEACPVRAECLAFGIMVRDQYGHLRRTAVARPTPGAEDRAGGRIPVRPRRPDRRTAARPVHPREPRDRGGGTREGMQTPQDRAAQRPSATMARHHPLDRKGTGSHCRAKLARHPLLNNPTEATDPVPAGPNHSGNPYLQETGHP